MKLSLDLLKLQDRDSVKSTYYRSPRVSPNIRKISENCIQVNTVDDVVEIRRLEEVILSIIADFKFAPYWIVQSWYEDILGSKSIADEKVIGWVKVGLVWVETSTTGVYLRPTRFLIDMFGDNIEFTNYIPIPFGLLSHTISEEQLMFDIQMGNLQSEMWQVIKEENTLPCYHPLLTDLNNNPPENEQGTIIIREAQFRKGNTHKSVEKLLEQEELIRGQIMAGKTFTEEFSDFSLFPIVTYNQNENDSKNEIYVQNPDLIVPLPRQDGRAQSYAIELEISAKDNKRYNYIMQSYKNNIKFGKLFYLCGSQRIARLVKDAFQEIGGLGTCELFILPFTPPAMDINDFDSEDEKTQNKLFEVSKETNK